MTAMLMVTNTLLPLLGLWAMVYPHRGSRVEWIAKILLVFCYLVAVTLASAWLVPSIYAPYAYFALFALYVPIGWYLTRRRPWAIAGRWARIRVAVYLAIAALLLAVAAYELLERDASAGEAVALDFPLRDGTFYILRSDRSATLDVVAVDRYGQAAQRIGANDPAAYFVFGKAVYAPCDGQVRGIVDGLPDLPPPQTDAAQPLGNHVLLECGPAKILLAHLKQGTVRVEPGAAIRRGDLLGEVGNSGDAGEPNLRIRAQRTSSGTGTSDRSPLAMQFADRVLVRGDRVSD